MMQQSLQMRPVAQPKSLDSMTLLDLDLIPDQWHRMTIAERAAHIEQKLGVSPAVQLMIISRLDAENPMPRVIEYRERTVFVPQPAAQAAVTPAPQVTSMSAVGWMALVLLAGGILYATVNAK